MEDVLDVYARPRDPKRPVVCLDETTKQLVKDIAPSMPVGKGRPARVDYEYEQNGLGSLFMMCAPLESRRLRNRFEFHFTPKHASWLNNAECELNALSRQCLQRRIADLGELRTEVAAWTQERNAKTVRINWRFTTSDGPDQLALHHIRRADQTQDPLPVNSARLDH